MVVDPDWGRDDRSSYDCVSVLMVAVLAGTLVNGSPAGDTARDEGSGGRRA